ncbi:hypothetical protein ACI65C_006730 [Semiaphis heraclei]
MKINLYLSVLLYALVIIIVTANDRVQRSPQHYCGSRLADIMKVLCKGNYNAPNGLKRSQIDSDVLDYKDLEDYNTIDYIYQYLPKKESMSFIPSRFLRSPVKRNIIGECCDRPCYLSELQTYCGNLFIHLHKAVLNDRDDHDGMTLLFNAELKNYKNMKVKIHGFAEIMGIVDAELKFLDVFAGWPGRPHDARIYQCSKIGQLLILNNLLSLFPKSCHILGDGAYPLTPYKDNGHLSLKEKNFNRKLSSSRVLIEQPFGKLICRFRKFKHMDIYIKDFCGKVITAACCLHNICITNNDDIEVANSLQPGIIQELREEETTQQDQPKETLFEDQEDQEETIKKLKLYELIQGRGPEAFAALCRVLEETNNFKACEILTSSKTSKEEEQQLSSIEILDTTYEKTILEHDDSYVKIHPERKIMLNYEDKLPIRVYPMTSNPKGHALILNMNDIKGERTELDVDMANLNKLFKYLEFNVHSKANLTDKDIKNVIDEFMNICHSEKANSIIIFIMCHGEAGKVSSRSSDILAEDGITINTNWMIEQFIHKKKLPGNIPMLFFIDACRGQNNDFGWKYCNGENNLNHGADVFPIIGTISDKRYEDVFIAYATLPGCTAIRDPIDGSLFIQTLCKVFRENAYDTELSRMMCLVDIELDQLCSVVQHGFQTVEWSCRGFNKHFYFNPGRYDDNSDNDYLTTASTNPAEA